MVMIGKGKDIDRGTFRRLEAEGLVIHDAGEPGEWCRLTAKGVEVAEAADLRVREMPARAT